MPPGRGRSRRPVVAPAARAEALARDEVVEPLLEAVERLVALGVGEPAGLHRRRRAPSSTASTSAAFRPADRLALRPRPPRRATSRLELRAERRLGDAEERRGSTEQLRPVEPEAVAVVARRPPNSGSVPSFSRSFSSAALLLREPSLLRPPRRGGRQRALQGALERLGLRRRARFAASSMTACCSSLGAEPARRDRRTASGERGHRDRSGCELLLRPVHHVRLLSSVDPDESHAPPHLQKFAESPLRSFRRTADAGLTRL